MAKRVTNKQTKTRAPSAKKTQKKSASQKATPRKTSPAKVSAVKSKRTTAAKTKTAKKRTPIASTGRTAVAKKNLKSGVGSSATTQDPIQFPQESRPLPKTRLTDKSLLEFQNLLLSKRAELAGDVSRLTNEALNNKGSGPGEHSSMPIHMADLGTDNWEQEFTLGLLASEEALVREIDDALERIESKTYGVCLATHKRITIARLRAKPWAKYCIEHARAREEGRAI